MCQLLSAVQVPAGLQCPELGQEVDPSQVSDEFGWRAGFTHLRRHRRQPVPHLAGRRGCQRRLEPVLDTPQLGRRPVAHAGSSSSSFATSPRTRSRSAAGTGGSFSAA